MPTGANSVRVCIGLRDPTNTEKPGWESFNMYLQNYKKGNWASRFS